MTNLISKKAVLAQLTISLWGARKFDKNATKDVLDKNSAISGTVTVNKRLLAKEAMAKILSLETEARTLHKKLTQPWFHNGVDILSTLNVRNYTSEMGKLKDEFNNAVDTLVAGYVDFQVQAQANLGALYNEDDYPDVSSIRGRFHFEITFMPYPETSDFRADLDPELLEEIRKELDVRLNDQVQVALQNTAERIIQTVGHMAERLKVFKPADPKKKGTRTEGRFNDSMVDHVRELAELLPAFNLTNDPKLTAIYEKITNDLCPHEPAELRKSAKLRKEVQRSAESILKDVSDFLA